MKSKIIGNLENTKVQFNLMLRTFTEINNGDGSYGYNVWTIRTLTIDDNGAEVTCSVTPKRGNAVHETRILYVMCKCNNYYSI